MFNKYNLFIVGLCAVSLSACSATKEQFDFSQKAPDEFAVVKRAPLELPPNYTLRPPTPGAPRPQEQGASEQAEAAIFGDTTETTQAPATTMSTGEQILLQKTGAQNVNPNIRNIIDKETVDLAEENKPTIDRILGKAGKKYDAPTKTIDPVKESERIMQTTKPAEATK